MPYQPSNSPWPGVELLAGGAALRCDWESALGRALGPIARFLVPIEGEGYTVPCRAQPPCDCRHVIGPQTPGGRFPATCVCGGDFRCATFYLRPEERVFYAFDLPALGVEIARLLTLQPGSVAPARGHGWCEIGTWPGSGAPVYLSFARPELLRAGLEALPATGEMPFVLVTGTRDRCDESLEQFLQRSGAAQLVLEEVIEVEPGGELRLLSAAGNQAEAVDRWVRFPRSAGVGLRAVHRELAALRTQLVAGQVRGPAAVEPVPEDVARQLFALVQQLESSGRWRKAPVLQVFRLYCLENLTAKEVARRCGCAKSLVVHRLGLIRKATGRDPAQLRVYSDQFERIENSLRDPRARRRALPEDCY